MDESLNVRMIKRKHCKLVVLILVFILLTPTALYARFQVESRHVLAESKNAEIALRLLGIEYYGADKHIYDPLRPDGLAEGAAEEIRSLSGAEGELTLGAWDAARGAADRFTYTKGRFVVVYEYDDEQDGRRWRLCYQFRTAEVPEYGMGAGNAP